MAKNTIRIKSANNIINEKEADAALSPGYLIELISTGKVKKHATAGGPVYPMFALEDDMQGRGIGDDYDTSDNLWVQVWIPGRGDEVYAEIKSTSENVVIGDFVESAGDGTLRKWDIASTTAIIEGSHVIVGIAKEAIAAGGNGVIMII